MPLYRIFGCVHDANTFYCEDLARRLAAFVPEESISVEFSFMYEVDYWTKLHDLRNSVDPSLLHHKTTHLVVKDHEVIGDIYSFIVEAKEVYGFEEAEVSNTIIYNRQVRELTYDMMTAGGNPVYTLRFGIEGERDFEDLGIIHVELFSKICPHACENFVLFCQGAVVPGLGLTRYQYRDCPVHRIVKNGWIQTGDVVDGTGKNSICAFGSADTIPDECFSVDFGFPQGGIIGNANEGAHSSRSQFFITLGPCAWMNHKYQGFGRIIQGFKTLEKLNQVPVSNQTPINKVKILDCRLAPEMQMTK